MPEELFAAFQLLRRGREVKWGLQAKTEMKCRRPMQERTYIRGNKPRCGQETGPLDRLCKGLLRSRANQIRQSKISGSTPLESRAVEG